MENRVNVTEELVKRFNALGYPCQEGTPDHSLVCCFIHSNLIKLLGTATPLESDVELITTMNYLELTSTFYKDPIIFEINRTRESVMINMINQNTGEELARITNYGGHVTNVVFDRDNFMEHSYDVVIGRLESYRYRREEVDGEERNLLYDGALRSMNVRSKNREVFDLTRVYPEKKKPTTFKGKLIGALKPASCVYVPIIQGGYHTIAFTDGIFAELEADANKIVGEPTIDATKLELK